MILLVDQEMQCRRTRRQRRLIRRAGLRLAATLGEIEYRTGRGLERRQIAELGHCGWIGRAQNLLVIGPCGSGKTYIACALAHAACLLDLEVRYMRLPELFEACGQARASSSSTA